MSHPVRKLIGQRGSGKTYRLFEMAEKDGGYVLTTIKRKKIMQDYARKLGFHVNVISVQDIVNLQVKFFNEAKKAGIKNVEEAKEYCKKFDTKVYIDDLDEFIDDLLPGFINIQAVTLTSGYDLMIQAYKNEDFKK